MPSISQLASRLGNGSAKQIYSRIILITILNFTTINSVFLGLCIDVDLLSKMDFYT